MSIVGIDLLDVMYHKFLFTHKLKRADNATLALS